MFKECFLRKPHLHAVAVAKVFPIAGDIDKPHIGLDDDVRF